MDYYDLPYVSNSSLTELERMLAGGSLPTNIESIFSFGRLTDELIFEPEKADSTHPEHAKASKMRDAFMKDSFLKWMVNLPSTEKQKVYLFEKKGVRCKMKADAVNVPSGMLLEFKTTAATTQKQFEQVIDHFDIDRQVAFYLDGSELEKCLIVGVSKKAPHPVFKYAIDRFHPLYQQGKQKYEKLLQLCILYQIGVD